MMTDGVIKFGLLSFDFICCSTLIVFFDMLSGCYCLARVVADQNIIKLTLFVGGICSKKLTKPTHYCSFLFCMLVRNT